MIVNNRIFLHLVVLFTDREDSEPDNVRLKYMLNCTAYGL